MSNTALTAEHAAAATKTHFGFWVYLMTDCLIFASLFATYAVLHNNTANGPTGSEIFDLPFVLIETMVLLTSSVTAGFALLAAQLRARTFTLVWLSCTALLGAIFVGMELYEFSHLVSEGHSWQTSGFLSAYFTLVATHGLHICIGLLWLFVLAARIWKQGVTDKAIQRLTLFSLFWHFLDIVWICIFSVVYLLGAA